MKAIIEMLNLKQSYYLVHAAAEMTWGAAIVMVHVSILTGFWTINTYSTLVWACLVQVTISLYYHRRTTFSVAKGLGIAALAAVITITLSLVMARYGL